MRMTEQTESGAYRVAREAVRPVEGGYAGDAVERLAKFEDLREELEAAQEELSRKMAPLRAAGRTSSAQFRELMGKKLMNSQILLLLSRRGL
ncbi:hypothetical protein H8711_04365 [Clostridiaceae bacterium NSJ-31]|uniref:Uncharacterized protein n=1 Tax=Ligaoa zhengdingensis TaxID=2763658 RepID=A0A926I3A8_9FIRM|nr:hypothetical protein [Ligaoa zhengdingensis]MBC8546169.1 hypothetical protein [Ligaoa zhengdingensis]